MWPLAAVQLGSRSMQQQRLCIVLAICLHLLSPVQPQVVQPLWLMRPDLLPSPQSTKVIVTPQKLKEVATIRASIQKAVSEDSYVVAANSQQVQGQTTGRPLSFGAPFLPLPTLPPLPAFRLPNFWRPRRTLA